MTYILRGLLAVGLLAAFSAAQAQEPSQQPTRTIQLRAASEDSASASVKGSLFTTTFLQGVLLSIQNAPEEEIRAAFAEAIRIDPNRSLEGDDLSPNLAVIFSRRPLLARIYREVREQMVGCVYVISEPAEAAVYGVQGDSVIFRKTTPALVCDLLTNETEIVFVKSGFQEHILTIQPIPGWVDTLSVTLTPETVVAQSEPKVVFVQPEPESPADSLQMNIEPVTIQKAGGGKWKTWLLSGIAVAGAATVAAVVGKRDDDGGNGGNGETPDLPGPPPRPVLKFK